MVPESVHIERYHLPVPPLPIVAAPPFEICERSNVRPDIPSEYSTPIQFYQARGVSPDFLSIKQKTLTSYPCPKIIDLSLIFFNAAKESASNVVKNPYDVPRPSRFDSEVSSSEAAKLSAYVRHLIGLWSKHSEDPSSFKYLKKANKALDKISKLLFTPEQKLSIALWKKQVAERVSYEASLCLKSHSERHFSIERLGDKFCWDAHNQNPQTDNTGAWYRAGMATNALEVSRTLYPTRYSPAICSAIPVASPVPAALQKSVSACPGKNYIGTSTWSGTACNAQNYGPRISKSVSANQIAWWGRKLASKKGGI